MPILPPSRVDNAILNPWPSSPIKFSIGTLTFSKYNSDVSEARIPKLFSGLPTSNPSNSLSMTKHDMPLCPTFFSVIAKTITVSELMPLVTQFLVPFII